MMKLLGLRGVWGVAGKLWWGGGGVVLTHNFKFNMRMYLWWSLCTLYLQVRVIVGDSGLCCYICYVFQALINSLVCCLIFLMFFKIKCCWLHDIKYCSNNPSLTFDRDGGVSWVKSESCIWTAATETDHTVVRWLLSEHQCWQISLRRAKLPMINICLLLMGWCLHVVIYSLFEQSVFGRSDLMSRWKVCILISTKVHW